jgi:hypothetical protein
MEPKNTIKLAIAGIIAVVALIVVTNLFGKNEDTQFTVKQPISGEMSVVDRGGYYYKGMATIWKWNKFEDFYFSRSDQEGGDRDESIRITFNDGGQADVSIYTRIELPMDEEARILFNRQFSGNPENIKSAIRSHLINCLKNTAPMMQSSEHQSARKTEFDAHVYDQLVKGLYQMQKEAVKTLDETDTTGKEITVYVTNIITGEDGAPVIAKKSPLDQYGIKISQFSITGVEYDPKTRELFAAKKESSLLAEKSKAERIQETQQRLMVEEKGLREKAEIEAVANVEKAEAVIKAEKEKEMAEIAAQLKVAVEEQAKLEAEIAKAKELAIELADKEIAETAAEKQLEVAKLMALAAEEEAKAIRTLAEAEEEKIFRAGAITEREQVLAEIAKERDIGIAEYLAQIPVPQVTIGGGTGTEGSADSGKITTDLINLKLLEGAGLLDKSQLYNIPQVPQSLRGSGKFSRKTSASETTPVATPVSAPATK